MSFSENFIEIMDAIGENVGIAIDWTNKNIMPYMEQLCGKIVNYELYTSIAWLVFMLILLVVGVILLIKGTKKMKDPERSVYDELFIFPMVIGSVLIFVSLIVCMIQVGDIITCLTLPEKTVMEFIIRYK